MNPLLWSLAALAAIGLVLWAYGAREERVPGRFGPAALRMAALFLMLAGLVMPALRGRIVGTPERVVLVDASASMALPARVGGAGPTRLDSAVAEVARLRPDRLYTFGDAVAAVPLDEIDSLAPAGRRSRVLPALEAARLGGADSVWVVTDGHWTDRVEALEAARGLGLGVREIRVASEVARAGISAVLAPQRARAGDTVRVAVEIRAAGGATDDSVTVDLQLDGTLLARSRVPRPTAGRALATELEFVPLDPGGRSTWRRYEVVLAGDADPLGVSDRVPAWIEISEASTGAVLVSFTPDWEARFLVPSLERLVLGGARGFLRLADGRFLDMSANPRVVGEDVVRSALSGARLLVAQGNPEGFPGWLSDALESHPRVLVLPRAPGEVPGTGVRLTGPLPGEWYPTGPIPPSPAAALLTDVQLDPLPPVTELYAVDDAGARAVLNATRNRRGEGRPLMIAAERGVARWAVASGADWWRWAARGGAARRVYDGVFAGIVGWLVEDATSELAALVEVPGPDRAFEWRVRAGDHEPGHRHSGRGWKRRLPAALGDARAAGFGPGIAGRHVPDDHLGRGSGRALHVRATGGARARRPRDAAGRRGPGRRHRRRPSGAPGDRGQDAAAGLALRARDRPALRGVDLATSDRTEMSDFKSERRRSLWRRIVDFALTDVNTIVEGGIDEDAIERLEQVLLEADFGVETAMDLISVLERESERGRVRTPSDLRGLLASEIVDALRAGQADGPAPAGRLARGDDIGVILVLGVNGVGKTTSVAKLAHRLASSGDSVLLAAADTFRAGAQEQLAEWAARLGVEFVGGRSGADPAAVAFDAVEAALARGVDWVIVDTAGRLHTQTDLMSELVKIDRVVARKVDGAPHERLLVVDATSGQNVLNQARQFGAELELSGLVLAKFDSTARAGTAVAVARELSVPVRFLGTGERLEDLEPFTPDDYVEKLLGPIGE